jgi:hypothetical protein
VECENESDTSNKRAAGTISKPFRQYLTNVPESTSARNYTNSHIVHSTDTAASADVTVQNI